MVGSADGTFWALTWPVVSANLTTKPQSPPLWKEDAPQGSPNSDYVQIHKVLHAESAT